MVKYCPLWLYARASRPSWSSIFQSFHHRICGFLTLIWKYRQILSLVIVCSATAGFPGTWTRVQYPAEYIDSYLFFSYSEKTINYKVMLQTARHSLQEENFIFSKELRVQEDWMSVVKNMRNRAKNLVFAFVSNVIDKVYKTSRNPLKIDHSSVWLWPELTFIFQPLYGIQMCSSALRTPSD